MRLRGHRLRYFLKMVHFTFFATLLLSRLDDDLFVGHCVQVLASQLLSLVQSSIPWIHVVLIIPQGQLRMRLRLLDDFKHFICV